MSNYKKTLPVTKSDAKMSVKHHLATINHNLTHGNDHFKANVDRLNGLSKVDPAQAANQATMIKGKITQTANQFNKFTKGNNMSDTENAADAKKPGDAKEDKLKKTGSTGGKSNKLGGGGRFQQLVNQGKSPALAAYIGRKSLGKKTFQSLASKGRAKAS